MTEQRATYDAGDTPAETYTLELTALELISLNRALNLWLVELRQKRQYTNYGAAGVSIGETEAIAAGVLRRVDKLLGVTR